MAIKTDEKENTRYTKPNRSCPFCNKSCGEKLSRHIRNVHKNEKDVQIAMKLPKKEQLRAFGEFKKQGILQRNRKCAKEEEEPAYQRERCTGRKDALLICGICKGFYAKKYFSRHHKMCRGDTAIPPSSVSVSLLSTDPNTEISCQGFASEILSRIKDDEIGEMCKTDPVIRNIGMRLWERVKRKIDKKNEVRKSVRTNMRRLAALYLTFKEAHEVHNSDKELKEDNAGDLFDRTNFQVLVESVGIFTLDKDTQELKPGLKIGVYYLLKKAATITKATYLANAQDDKATEIDKFLEVLKLNENFVFGDATYSLNKNRQTKLRKPQQLPLKQDVEKLRTHTLQKVEAMVNDKHLFWDRHQFVRLRDLTVSRLTLFNARRGGEPCRLKIEEWQDAENGVWVDQQMAEEVTDPIEKQLLDQLKICYQTGKGNNHLVSVLFPKDTFAAMRTLCDPEVRSTAQINVANPYIFASTKGSEEHFSGWHALNNVCENAGMENKEQLNATRNRHRISTIYAALELPPEEQALFYKHMGHSEDINKNVYQTPMAIQEITKVGRTLQKIDGKGSHQLENGSVGKKTARQTLQEFSVNSKELGTKSVPTMPGPAPKRSKLEKGRSYTSWHEKDAKLVFNYFVEIIKGGSSKSIPGKQECETFLRKTGLMVEWTAVRNKVMNERVKWQKKVNLRLDDLGIES
nr:uncharacterized protein LOC129279772 [Lytechinus pictus]